MTPEDMLDKIVLGSHVSPGRVRLRGHDRARDWDIKAAAGQTGASSSLNGQPIGEFEAEFTLAVDPHWEWDEIADWTEFQRVLDSMTSSPTPMALPIYHPDLARNHFSEVSVANVGGLVHDGKGGAVVVVKFIEYRPPRPVRATSASARSGSGSAAQAPGTQPRPDPNAAAKREVAELLAQAEAV